MEDFFRAGARTRAYLRRPNANDLITACSRLCLRHKKAKEKLISAHTIFRFIEQLAGGHKNSFIKWSTLSPIHKTSELIWLMASQSMMSILLWRSHIFFFLRPSNDCNFCERKMSSRPKWSHAIRPKRSTRIFHVPVICITNVKMEINSHDRWAQKAKDKNVSL